MSTISVNISIIMRRNRLTTNKQYLSRMKACIWGNGKKAKEMVKVAS